MRYEFYTAGGQKPFAVQETEYHYLLNESLFFWNDITKRSFIISSITHDNFVHEKTNEVQNHIIRVYCQEKKTYIPS